MCNNKLKMILFCGDYAPEKKRILSNKFKSYLKNIEYIVLNYEGTSEAIHKRNLNKFAKGYSPIINDDLLIEILNQGVKVICSLANNHTLDFGKEGFYLTAQHLRKLGCYVIGPKSKKGKILPNIHINYKNFDVNILSAAEHSPGEPSTLTTDIFRCGYNCALNKIRGIKKHKRKEVLYFHSGVEFIKIPNPSLVNRMDKMISAGYSYVFVHHQHVALPIHMKNKKLIAYGLGNMAFDCLSHKDHLGTNIGLAIGVKGNNENKAYQIYDHGFEIDLIDQEIFAINKDHRQFANYWFNYEWSKASYLRLFNKDIVKPPRFTKINCTENLNFFKFFKKIFKKFYWIKLLRLLSSENERDILYGSIFYFLSTKLFYKTK